MEKCKILWKNIVEKIENGSFFEDLKNCKEEPVCRVMEGKVIFDLMHFHDQ